MSFRWYFLYWRGFVGPIPLFAAVLVLGVMWRLRLLSNRSYLGAVYCLVLAWTVHMDHMAFSGFQGLYPAADGWAPVGIRVALYAALTAFLTWGAWGWAKIAEGSERIMLSRGLPYLSELRKRQREDRHA